MILLAMAWAATPTDELVKPDILPAWSTESGEAKVTGRWWTSLSDPTLDRLMDEALNTNRDLAAAFARARVADASADGNRSFLMPSVSFDVGGQIAPTASRGFQFGGFNIPGTPEPPKTFCTCRLYTSPSPRDATLSRMQSSA